MTNQQDQKKKKNVNQNSWGVASKPLHKESMCWMQFYSMVRKDPLWIAYRKGSCLVHFDEPVRFFKRMLGGSVAWNKNGKIVCLPGF